MKLRKIWVGLGMVLLLAGMVQAQEPEASSSPQAVVLGQERSAQQAFGRSAGYIHPFLSISERYTDNLYKTSNDKKSDYITTISPGLWLALPGARQPLLQLATSSSSPGGVAISRFETETKRPLQAYGLYRAGIEQLHNNRSDNLVTHRAEGMVQYNLRGGLSLGVLDIYERDHDAYETGLNRTEINAFRSNLVNSILTYKISPKFKLRGDYSYYTLKYEADRNAFRERADNGFALYAFYKVLPKTSVFVEYEFVDIDYDLDTLSDSKEYHYFTGLDWNMTGKSKGRIKVGYGVKDFDRKGVDNRDDLILEAQVDHRFTSKASMFVKVSRRTEETDLATTQDMLSDNLQVGYTQNLTDKIAASIKAAFSHNSYDKDLTIDNKTAKRSDDYYSGNLALGYTPQEWLNLGVGYAYSDRNSNFATFDYKSHTVYGDITFGF
jgi:polysaccharide biosynthesis protein VpsM